MKVISVVILVPAVLSIEKKAASRFGQQGAEERGSGVECNSVAFSVYQSFGIYSAIVIVQNIRTGYRAPIASPAEHLFSISLIIPSLPAFRRSTPG